LRDESTSRAIGLLITRQLRRLRSGQRGRPLAEPVRCTANRTCCPSTCAAAVAVGLKIEGEPENWLIVDGKLFVFAGPVGAGKMRASPADMIANGQEHWKTLVDAPYR